MNFKKANKLYKAESGTDYCEPCQSQSAHKGDAWLLSDRDGRMVALVLPDQVLFGLELRRWNFREREAVQQMQEDACR